MPKLTLPNRILAACSILGFVGTIVIFDLGCPSDNSNPTATVSVTVSNVPVATVTVSGAATVALNATAQFTATAKDAAGNVLTGRTVDWSSSNPAIASVSQAGLVTGNLVGGPVTITATIEF